MKLVLVEDVDKLGKVGDVVDVAPGYGRNYLVPRRLAVAATASNIQDLEARRQRRLEREAEEQAVAERLAGRLSGEKVQLEARTGKEGRLYGSITAADVAEAINSQLGVAIDRKNIELSEPIKSVGSHQVTLALHAGVQAQIGVEVAAEETTTETTETTE